MDEENPTAKVVLAQHNCAVAVAGKRLSIAVHLQNRVTNMI
jgi:hypothetical protein